MKDAANGTTVEVALDRIEGDMAVLEVEGLEVPIPMRLLPRGAREGDWYRLSLVPMSERPDSTAP